ncbi:hypothetical protein [Bartonella sp. AA126HLJHH]|uniref:hypothetical protein n=1 Tax=Bartonella sp. AA126HLJHH TaxID=3243426 RepID=UPI0035D1322D
MTYKSSSETNDNKYPLFKHFIFFAIVISAVLFTHHTTSGCTTDGLFVGSTSPINCISKEYIRQKIKKKILEKEREREWLELEQFSVSACLGGKFPVYYGVSIIDCVSEEELKQNRLNQNRFNNEINIMNLFLQWFIVAFVITTIMSVPISLLWRFRFKVPACLFTIMTTLAIIAVPFTFDLSSLF